MVSLRFHILVLASLTVGHTLAQAGTNVLQERATPTCSVSPESPPPQGYVCNQVGRVQAPTPIATTTAKTADICRDACLNDQPECVSFSYGPRRQCITYSNKILASRFRKDPSTGRTFWNRRCFEKKCGLCPGTLTNCKRQCVDTQSDNNNCGFCGGTCTNAQTCQNGQCACANGTRPDFQTDNNNCGTCGNQCSLAETCMQGTCQPNSCAVFPTGTPCESGVSGDSCCNGTCTDLSTDDNNCGSCGNGCDSTNLGEHCYNGSCGCASGSLGDLNNCGRCGNVCPANSHCSGGAFCICNADNYFPCNGVCGLNYQTDNNNCGSCGNKCDTSQGYQCCSGSCRNTTSDNNNCGSCGNYCGSGGYCSASTCVCIPPAKKCGNRCVDTTSDDNNCGNCNTRCYTSNGFHCVNGHCDCPNGFPCQQGKSNQCCDLDQTCTNFGCQDSNRLLTREDMIANPNLALGVVF